MPSLQHNNPFSDESDKSREDRTRRQERAKKSPGRRISPNVVSSESSDAKDRSTKRAGKSISPKAAPTKVDHQKSNRVKVKATGAKRSKSPSNFNPRRGGDRRNRKTEDSSNLSFERSKSPKSAHRRRRMKHVNETRGRSPEWAKKSKSSTRDLLEGGPAQEKDESKKLNQRSRSPKLELTSDDAKRKRRKPKKGLETSKSRSPKVEVSFQDPKRMKQKSEKSQDASRSRSPKAVLLDPREKRRHGPIRSPETSRSHSIRTEMRNKKQQRPKSAPELAKKGNRSHQKRRNRKRQRPRRSPSHSDVDTESDETSADLYKIELDSI